MCNRAAIIRKGKINAVENIQNFLKKQMKKARFIFKEKQIFNSLMACKIQLGQIIN